MASIVITIETDGAAFRANTGYEVARILLILATKYLAGGYSRAALPCDINGNNVGTIEVID